MDLTSLLWIKVLGLAGAGIGFVWWQLRDVAKARKNSSLNQNTRHEETQP